MSILKLRPSCKDYLWGGRRLAEEYGIEYDGEILAEAWELSCHPDGPSMIVNGPFAGKSLKEYIDINGREVLGTHCRRFRDFPILIKFIDAKQNLSIQVHPNNQYALKNEGQFGKTEMWYIMDANEGAFLYYGFKKEIGREEFAQRIQEDTLLEVLNKVPVQKGDILFIESGTIHAIGQGIMIAEIQQNSNVTYRVYDYGRVGKDGKKRDLHIEKAVAVTKRVPIVKNSSYPHVADCDYFTVDKLNLDGKMMKKMEGMVTEDSFVSILILDGTGLVTCKGERLAYQKGDSLFLPAGSGAYEIEGSCDALVTSIREKAGLVRIGIDIGGRNTKIGLVDAEQKLLAYREIPLNMEKTPKESLEEIGTEVLSMMEEKRISIDQCASAGVGVAGTVLREKGVILYSNNIGWEQVPVEKILADFLPIPIYVANNGDCAALGEAAAGAARDYQDVLMLTIGRGVGSGLILNGKVYERKKGGSVELGHMVIVENGRKCTCGRRGCMEAYISAAAVRKETEEKMGRPMELQELFRMAKEGDAKAQIITEDYIRKLGTGIVNMTNIFRPQAIIIGGNLAEAGKDWLRPLRALVERSCFGGGNSMLPEIEVSELGRRAGVIGAANLQ